MGLDGAAKFTALTVYVHQPEGELVLEEMALASAITLNVGQLPVALQATSGTVQWLASSHGTNGMLK